MDPNLLRLATDPEARRDPAFMKATISGMHRATRDKALGTMRVNNLVMGILGSLGILGGLGAAVLGLAGMVLPQLGIPGALLGGALLPLLLGVLFAGLSYRYRVPPKSLLTEGVPASAQVVVVRGMGTTVGLKQPGMHVTLSRVTVALRVTPPNGAPFDVEHEEMMLGSDLRFLQNGATVPVRLAASNPRKLTIDWNAIEG